MIIIIARCNTVGQPDTICDLFFRLHTCRAVYIEVKRGTFGYFQDAVVCSFRFFAPKKIDADLSGRFFKDARKYRPRLIYLIGSRSTINGHLVPVFR